MQSMKGDSDMANVQPQFEQFHEAIKLRRFGENEILRDKRDIIRRKLEKRLPQVFEDHDEEVPEFRFRDQGSYEFGTGVKPLDGDYDIDQGLYFTMSSDSYPDPVVLKKSVYTALFGHTANVRIRRSCVTVSYQEDGEPIYHVDIAIYVDGSEEPDGKARLAKGHENSADEYRVWELSEPQALIDLIEGKFTDNHRAQFRRVIQYLKRWRDENFSLDGHAAPLGIGLTVAAYYDLNCRYSDYFTGKPDDRAALRDLVATILGRFITVEADLGTPQPNRRFSLLLPVEPHNDLFERMTDAQMTVLETKLSQLQDALDAAEDAVDPVLACRGLRNVFGEDFPVPPPEETAKKHARAIVSSSSSA